MALPDQRVAQHDHVGPLTLRPDESTEPHGFVLIVRSEVEIVVVSVDSIEASWLHAPHGITKDTARAKKSSEISGLIGMRLELH